MFYRILLYLAIAAKPTDRAAVLEKVQLFVTRMHLYRIYFYRLQDFCKDRFSDFQQSAC
jgi:hypothetical protein